MSTWLRIWPPWKEPKTPENNQIVKVSSKKPETTPLQQEIIATYTYILVVYSEDEQKYKFLCQLTEREKKYLSQVLLAYRPLN